ncbi:hypothetical protein FOMPIDRAFT_1047990 [Fomitopsis schrenkii]|uniref:Uncharacterized protein n=1 Tax=Fomitopsis schrenkii TaxID=2126942 RepID=S8FVN5_FOMSC|nr:hypothetical protein FOMPIDRAFT_1047990 [Fomitopsis schrenkii]
MPPATSDPYTGCLHCSAYQEHKNSLYRLSPLPSDGVLAVDPDGINWNDCYWGYKHWGGNRSERRMIVRPLPRSITDRIPLELFEHILDFLRWETRDLYNWPDLSFLACCTRLSTLELSFKANPIDSWQGLVTGLHEMLSRCSSPVMRSLGVFICMVAPEGSPSTSIHPDSEFWTIDLGSIHDIMKQPLFDSLQDATEEMERRLRLILEPWDKRGVLTVDSQCYYELTDEELRRGKAEEARITEEGDSSAGAEAQSSKDETVLTSDQEDEDGREGAVSDLVESSEG